MWGSARASRTVMLALWKQRDGATRILNRTEGEERALGDACFMSRLFSLTCPSRLA